MLSGKQQKFVGYVLGGQSAKAAYIKAGYKGRGNIAESAASRLLRNVKVEQEINKSQQKATEVVEITVENLLKEEQCLAHCDITQIFEDSKNGGSRIHPRDLPEPIRRALSGIDVVESYGKGGKKLTKYKYRFWDKGRALERLEKIKGMYNDNTADNVTPPVVILNLSGDDNKVQVNICSETPQKT